jgi:hypothetical protein
MEMETPLTFDALLDTVSALPPERQETLIDLVRRLSERRRDEIAQNAVEARALFASGKLPRGTVDELMTDILDADE